MAGNRWEVAGGPVLRVTSFYLSVTVLALYGDIFKRFLPSTVALGMSYSAALLILIAIGIQRGAVGSGPAHRSLTREARWINLFTGLLIATYIAQFLTSFDSPFMKGLTHLLYMVIPLLYILVVQKARFNFSLADLGRYLLWLMIPINIVGLIQYTLDPSFLISTAYVDDDIRGSSGGVISRNLLEEGTFARYPAIFASADRYSAMALMQFYFSCMLLTAVTPLTRKAKLWMAFNLLSSFVALGIAGARSRVLIVIAMSLLIAITSLIQVFRRGRTSRTNFYSTLLVGGIVVFAALYLPMLANEDYPFLLFLKQTFESGDIGVRIDEAITYSYLPLDITLFGTGLGTVGVNGKPGEFGIQSTWIESGVIWGTLILTCLFAICLILAKLMLKALLSGQRVRLIMVGVPLLLLIFALLAGLTSSFELSSGMLLGYAVAVACRKQYLQQRY